MYKVTVSYDGQPAHFNLKFDNALDAVNCFNKFTDWGFAMDYSTVNLLEPNAKLHTKTLYRDGRVVLV